MKNAAIAVIRLFYLDHIIITIPSKKKLISIHDLHHTSSTSGNFKLSTYYLTVLHKKQLTFAYIAVNVK